MSKLEDDYIKIHQKRKDSYSKYRKKISIPSTSVHNLDNSRNDFTRPLADSMIMEECESPQSDNHYQDFNDVMS